MRLVKTQDARLVIPGNRTPVNRGYNILSAQYSGVKFGIGKQPYLFVSMSIPELGKGEVCQF